MGSTCAIGKARTNLVQLKGWSVAGLHAEVHQREEGIFLLDRGSGSGTKVNGERVNGEYGPVQPDDEVQIANYVLRLARPDDGRSPGPKASDRKAVDASESTPRPVAPVSTSTPLSEVGDGMTSLMSTMVGVRPRLETKTDDTLIREARFVWRNRVHGRLLEVMDLRRLDVGGMDEEELRSHVGEMIAGVIQELAVDLPPDLDRDRLHKEVLDEAVGLGPLEALIADGEVTEILVNRFDDIFVERSGKLGRSNVTFSSDDAVMSAIERIVSPLGRRIDESSPMVDARLKDGSRVNAIIPPLALKGPCLTIRKFAEKKLTDQDLLGYGSISEPMVALLKIAVEERRNVVISGGTGSGKTTLLNILSNFIPADERIITVEDAAELKLNQPHIVSLEARPPNLEGRGQVSIRDLVKNCLRMRPDRIVVGECRGGEALDMLQAMNTGHDGSLTTAHANSSRDALSRLEVMVLMAGMDLPVSAIREQMASAVQMIVQQSRFADGTRKVTQITEVTGVEEGIIQLQDIFVYRQHGFDEDGRVVGGFEATGRVPQFYEELRERGVEVDFGIFE
ncbi:MAG: ATPase, T2SS/T4P/T4SS family [Myxococcota bacterium]